jgi:thymidylate synthase
MIRRDRLYMLTSMRSNDAFWGLPHDVFCFTMLQEIMARALSVEIGPYKHAVGSLHLYDESAETARKFLDEGWQSTMPMPPMPTGDPWPAIDLLLEAESAIRTRSSFDVSKLNDMDPYWADLIRLLQIFRFKKEKDRENIRALRTAMSSETYLIFIDGVLSQLR